MAQSLKGKKVLWLGTSIPAGCTYPKVACESLDMTCINKSVGSSFLSINKNATGKQLSDGFSLAMSASEKEAWAESLGGISKKTLDMWMRTSYDSLLDPYVRDVDIIVIDHGYNDNFALESGYPLDTLSIDWSSEDKSTFVGAFNFIYNRIRKANPNAIVVIGGYFQNSCSIGYTIRGKMVSDICEKISQHYNLPLLDVWNYNSIPDGFAPNSSNYLDSLNTVYRTNFDKVWKDSNGNITWFQKFCPDGVHPFSDPTGHSDIVLNRVFTQLLRNRLEPLSTAINVPRQAAVPNITEMFRINGDRAGVNDRGVLIVRYSDGITRKILK